MTTTRSVTRRNQNNNGTRTRALSVVASHVYNSPVSRSHIRNGMTAASIHRLILAIPALYRQHRSMVRAPSAGAAIPRQLFNFVVRSDAGRRFHRILRNARIVNRHRNGGVTFVLPPTSQYAGRYRLHPNGHVTGNGANYITGGRGGLVITNITHNG